MNLQRSLFLAVFSGVFLWGAEAQLSRIHYEAIELDEMVAQSSVVLVAQQAQPPTTSVAMSIVPPGKKPDADKYPPFNRVKSRYVVREILKADRKVEPDATIEVDMADWRTKFDLHRRYYVEGVSKSPIYQRYQRAAIKDQDKVILFLQRSDAGLELVAENAMESSDKLDEVKRLLAKRK